MKKGYKKKEKEELFSYSINGCCELRVSRWCIIKYGIVFVFWDKKSPFSLTHRNCIIVVNRLMHIDDTMR